MNASTLMTRLILAAGGVAACSRSSSTIRPDTEANPADEAAAGAPGAMRRNDPRGSGAGPTALCNEQLACVAGTWCGYHTSSGSNGYFGPPSVRCVCTDQGRFSCLSGTDVLEAARRPSPQVCLPRQGECLGQGEPLVAALRRRFEVSCPGFAPDRTKPAAVRKNSEGQDECCYEGQFFSCEGRPLLVQGRPRWASLRGEPGWG